jgi:colicin import membrane protein
MKKYMILLMAWLPLAMYAQDNSWERPEVEKKQEKVKVNRDAKYLKGAVPVVDGKVVFSKHFNAPGKSADQIYDIINGYLEKMTTESNQMESSRVGFQDKAAHHLGASYEEWLVFKSSAFYLDRTRLYYVIEVKCADGSADMSISRIHYLYEENRTPQRWKAEEWITDEEAVNKKNTRLLPISGKFRRKTVDRVDFIFNKIESLLK